MTKRPSVQALEDILEKEIKVLDHGFIRVIDYMGDDSSIVQAARVSYGTGTKKVSEDKGLINYLLRHRHTTPFEMCEIKLHIKLPMFVAREWIRHRTANVNEYSARYSILDNEFYIPELEHLCTQSTDNKQGRADPIDPKIGQKLQDMLRENAEGSYKQYEYLLGVGHEEHPGIARELARMNLPINCYTQWYWKIDLHNLLHFIKLRADSHAQYEIRVYAEVIRDIVSKWVPFVYEAFMNHSVGGYTLSSKALEVVKDAIKGKSPEQGDMSKREWEELKAALDIS